VVFFAVLVAEAPQELAVPCGYPCHAFGEELDILAHATGLGNDNRRIPRRLAKIGLPENGAGRLLECHQRGFFLPARAADQLFTIDEGRFRVIPAAGLAAEILFKTLAPYLLPGSCLQTDEITELAYGIDQATVDGRCAPRSGMIAAWLAHLRRP